ncbi:hypothetical protein BC833DRAFT_564249 [Globomyces pollinis-pini]|nr:hypothetical protein BC833DRAFT_564249 [Globomyces pollinis-pini]
MPAVGYEFKYVIGQVLFSWNASSNLLQAMYADPTLSTGSFVWISFIYILFPILTYITSIPIAMLVKLAQSVLDEIEFLDLAAGIKKMHVEDDDFDYIYHLPTANPDQIIYRDPFAVKKEGIKPSKSRNLASMHSLSVNSRHSVKEIRNMLSPGENQKINRTRRNKSNQSSLKQGDGSVYSLSVNPEHGATRTSTNFFGAIGTEKYKENVRMLSDADIDDEGFIVVREEPPFKALPNIVYEYIHPVYIAIVFLIGMIVMVTQSGIVNFSK